MSGREFHRNLLFLIFQIGLTAIAIVLGSFAFIGSSPLSIDSVNSVDSTRLKPLSAPSKKPYRAYLGHATPLQVAKSLKPLYRLKKGDTVLLWRPDGSPVRVCIWKGWSAWSVDYSQVRCKSDHLLINVATAYLTSAEFNKEK